jgi:hypothetical protein
VFTDGPFLESKEYLAGFWIIEAADLDVALKLATEGSKACNRKVGGAARRKPPAAPTAGADVQQWPRRAGSLTTGAPESPRKKSGGGVGSGQSCS